jgi:hypothetical protein
MRSRDYLTTAFSVVLFGLVGTFCCYAGPEESEIPTEQIIPSQSNSGLIGRWLDMVTRIQAEQPSWVTPIVTVTPRLEQELRYDQFWESQPHGAWLDSYGGGKGLELIPMQNVEVILGIPAYQVHSSPKEANGFADWPLLFKYRILSGNAEHGDYILTAFLGFTFPTGNNNNTNHYEITTPTLAFGKGFGKFDVQSTFGVSIPSIGGLHRGPGTPILWNTALQYHLDRFFWPEVEFNYTYWPNGIDRYKKQLFVTPGIIFGRFPIHGRIGLTIGAGVQIAVTESPTYYRNVILTARLPF